MVFLTAWLLVVLLLGCRGEDPPTADVPPDGLLKRISAPAEGGAVTLVRASAGVGSQARRYLAERTLLRGPLLTRAGQVYDVSPRDAPPGRFPFLSVPHAGRGMREVVVAEAPQ